MKNKILKFFAYYFFLVAFQACDVSNKKLILINKTNDTVYYRLLTNSTLNKKIYLYKLNPNDSTMPDFVLGGKGEGVWEYNMNHESRDSTLNIFFFNTNPLNDSIINNKNYKWRGLKVEDLEDLGWIVKYPDDFK